MKFLAKVFFAGLLIFLLGSNNVFGADGYAMTDVFCFECSAYKEACEPMRNYSCNVSNQMFCCEVCGGCNPEQ